MSTYDDWLQAPYQHAQAEAEREEDAVEEYVAGMVAGDRDYLKYTSIEEIADVLDKVRAKLGEVDVPLSIRQAQVQDVIAAFQNEIGYRHVATLSDAEETQDWGEYENC